METQTKTPADKPLRCAIVGMGGFAGFHHEAVQLLEANAEAKLVATCDPQSQKFAQQVRQWRLQERGVRVFSDYIAMLDACEGELDMLIIPTPISLHASMHAEAVRRGIPVYLEKPPTLDPRELEEMIARDREATMTTGVGFNLIIEPTRQRLKQRIVSGEFGALEAVSLLGWRPRPRHYFRRNDWAGKLRSADGRLLLDSCFANAMGHYVHNALFWAGGEELLHWAPVCSVRAELCRAHDIEGADTFFVEATAATGVRLRLVISHACACDELVTETLLMQKARITYVVGSYAQIDWNDGRSERCELPQIDIPHLARTLKNYLCYLRGQSDRPATRLTDCRPFVQLNGLCYVSSSQIYTFPPASCEPVEGAWDDGDGTFLNIPGLREAAETFLAQGHWPQYCTQTRGTVTTADLPELPATVEAMALARREELSADTCVPQAHGNNSSR